MLSPLRILAFIGKQWMIDSPLPPLAAQAALAVRRHHGAHARVCTGHGYPRHHNLEQGGPSRTFSRRYGSKTGARSYSSTWSPSNSSCLPITQVLAFNPQPPAPTSAPKTKAWQKPTLPPRLQNQEPCWTLPGNGRRERIRDNRPMSASEQPAYSAPNSANMYDNPESLAKSLSLEDIASSSNEQDSRWAKEGIEDVSPTGSTYSDHYYSLFGTENNQSPFGLDILPVRADNAE